MPSAPLLQLPTETLVQILNYLGPSFFYEDVRRLTIFKRWRELAQPLIYQDLHFSSPMFRSFSHPSRFEDRLSHVQSNLITLGITLIEERQGQLPNQYWDDMRPDREDTWNKYLNLRLLRLAKAIGTSRRFQTLRVRALNRACLEWNRLVPDNCLSASVMGALLSMQSLTVLELRLVGLRSIVDTRPNDFHLCTYIGAMLPTLRRLRLQLSDICGDALKPPDDASKLPLEEVIVNLVMYGTTREGVSWKGHAVLCGGEYVDFGEPKQTILSSAEELATRMASPKVVRIFSYEPPQGDVESLDILTGKRMRQADDPAWDDDGETIVDASESESETDDSDDDDFQP